MILLFEMQEKKVSKIKAAEIAFKIENKITNNALGKQDHYIASFGGFKKITYKKKNYNSCFYRYKKRKFKKT